LIRSSFQNLTLFSSEFFQVFFSWIRRPGTQGQSNPFRPVPSLDKFPSIFLPARFSPVVSVCELLDFSTEEAALPDV
jgi:hypothetical protein